MTKKILQFSILISIVCFTAAYFLLSTSAIAKDPDMFMTVAKAYAATKNNGKSPAPNSTILEKKLDLSKIKNIEIENISVSVNLVTSDTAEENFLFQADSSSYSPEDVTFDYDGSKLKIIISENKKINLNFLTFSSNPVLSIKVPKSIESLKIKTTSGDVEVENLTLNKLGFSSTSGDMEINTSSMDELDIHSVSGDTKFNGSLKKLSHETTSGDLNLVLDVASPEIDIVTVSGDTEVSFTKSPDLKLEFSSVSGDLEIKSAGFNEAIEASDSVKKVLGNGTGQLHIKTVSGDVTIN